MRINGIFDAKICVVKGKCGMKLSVCNIAWTAEHDAKMYGKMKALGMEGIEIAPTRISFVKGNSELLKILFANLFRKYNVK